MTTSPPRPADVPATLSLADARGRCRVEFVWRDDRFVQRFFIDDEPVGESVDGGGEDAWPPSPPVQQLSLETIDGRDVLLGVGAAGTSHWSISVDVRTEDAGELTENAAEAFRFEWACRCKAPAEWLGSSYRFERSMTIEADEGLLESQAELVTVTPPSTETPPTFRWSYRIRLATSPEDRAGR